MPETTIELLPSNVRPVRYRLTLAPDLETFTFGGRETVEIEIVEPTSTITLNSVDIDIHSCLLERAGRESIAPSETTVNVDRETVTFAFDSPLPQGPARLHIEFAGELNEKLRGFYRSRYTDVQGEERYLATTQFESTDARRAFPCWDEPSLKATFQVILEVPSDLAAISNMPVVSESEVRPGIKSVHFDETPVMSTYLLAFIVGDLASVEARTDDGTLIRVWATRGKEEQGRFALETSVRLLDYFNQYFGIPYPLPKLDHLAIPDFAAGAMENWGAITYREIVLLVDPENSSARVRQTVAAIMSHEMAHMWFGDLVTMAWWNDLWLNESFASWMGDKAVDQLFPEWDMWTQFLVNDTTTALSLDGLKNSHPIEQEVKNPSEIEELFDAISYSKGASVLRMLEQFLGPDVFQKGLNRYLTRHEYGNARTQDLWDALAEASGQPVTAIMDSWVKQMGYPVLDVAVKTGADGVEVSTTQSRFLYEDIIGQTKADETLWKVPVSIRTPADAQFHASLMEDRELTISLDLESGSAPAWIKINPLQTGFYRTRYSGEDLARLTSPIRSRELPPADRLGIQNDAYALSKAGHIPASDFLTVARAYTNETDASVCANLATNLSGLDALLWDEPYYSEFEGYARGIFRPIAERTGWDIRPGEGHLDTLLRSTALSQLGSYGDEQTLKEAVARFTVYREDRSGVHPDIRGVVFGLAARQGDRSTYNAIWDLYRRATLEEEKLRLLMALGNFERPELLSETLDRALSDEVRLHDAISVVGTVSGNRLGRDMAWEFIKSNWEEFDRRYANIGFGIMRLVSTTSRFTTAERRHDVEAFFRDHPVPSAERTVRQSLERIDLNVAWLERNRLDLAKWFAK